jgi:hypothetical protein
MESMKTPNPTNEESGGPATGYIVAAVFLTVVAGVLLFVVAINIASESYRKEHALPDVEVRGIFSTSREPAPVTLDMLGAKTVLILLALAIVYSILFHPLLGRVVSRTIQILTEHIDSVYRLKEEAAWSTWDPGSLLVAGAAWPITVIVIPLLLIALVIGHVYRALWRW